MTTASYNQTRVVPLAERIQRNIAIDANGCWIWQRSIHCGYGQIMLRATAGRPRKLARAHRVSYEVLVGPIPEGLQIDHLCRIRACVNPAHLEPVTASENIRRSYWSPRQQATHCKRKHPFDALNTRIDSQGYRQCRACDRLREDAKDAGVAVKTMDAVR